MASRRSEKEVSSLHRKVAASGFEILNLELSEITVQASGWADDGCGKERFLVELLMSDAVSGSLATGCLSRCT